jgi:hypothetical protein
MTELYRGLLQILVMRCIEQIESLREHIRSHNSGKSEIVDFDIGVTGFWNLLLEIVFTMFTVIFLILGISLIAILAITSYPFAAFVNYGAWLFRNTRNPPNDELIIIKQNNEQEKK